MESSAAGMSINKATKLLAAKRKEEKGITEDEEVRGAPKNKPYKLIIDKKERLPVLKYLGSTDDNIFEKFHQLLISTWTEINSRPSMRRTLCLIHN